MKPSSFAMMVWSCVLGSRNAGKRMDLPGPFWPFGGSGSGHPGHSLDHKASITFDGSAPGWKMSSSSRSSQFFAGHPKRGRIGTSPRHRRRQHVSSFEGPEPALFEAQG